MEAPAPPTTAPRCGAVVFSAVLAPSRSRGWVPRVFKRIRVTYGAPVDETEFLAMPRTRETAQAVIDRVMGEIRGLQGELRP